MSTPLKAILALLLLATVASSIGYCGAVQAAREADERAELEQQETREVRDHRDAIWAAMSAIRERLDVERDSSEARAQRAELAEAEAAELAELARARGDSAREVAEVAAGLADSLRAELRRRMQREAPGLLALHDLAWGKVDEERAATGSERSAWIVERLRFTDQLAAVRVQRDQAITQRDLADETSGTLRAELLAERALTAELEDDVAALTEARDRWRAAAGRFRIGLPGVAVGLAVGAIAGLTIF